MKEFLGTFFGEVWSGYFRKFDQISSKIKLSNENKSRLLNCFSDCKLFADEIIKACSTIELVLEAYCHVASTVKENAESALHMLEQVCKLFHNDEMEEAGPSNQKIISWIREVRNSGIKPLVKVITHCGDVKDKEQQIKQAAKIASKVFNSAYNEVSSFSLTSKQSVSARLSKIRKLAIESFRLQTDLQQTDAGHLSTEGESEKSKLIQYESVSMEEAFDNPLIMILELMDVCNSIYQNFPWNQFISNFSLLKYSMIKISASSKCPILLPIKFKDDFPVYTDQGEQNYNSPDSKAQETGEETDLVLVELNPTDSESNSLSKFWIPKKIQFDKSKHRVTFMELHKVINEQSDELSCFGQDSLTTGYDRTKDFIGEYTGLLEPGFQSLARIMLSESDDLTCMAQDDCEKALMFLQPATPQLQVIASLKRKACELWSLFGSDRDSKFRAWQVRAAAIHHLQVMNVALTQIVNESNVGMIQISRIQHFRLIVDSILAERKFRECDEKVCRIFDSKEFAVESWTFHQAKWRSPTDTNHSKNVSSVPMHVVGQALMSETAASLLPGILRQMQRASDMIGKKADALNCINQASSPGTSPATLTFETIDELRGYLGSFIEMNNYIYTKIILA